MNKKLLLLAIFFISLVAVSAVSAAEDATDIASIDDDIVSDTLEIPSDDVSKEALSVSNDDETLSESQNWYVNSSYTGDEQSGTQEKPFSSLINALEFVQDGDTINIAGGLYTGGENIGLEINNKLNIVNWGDEEVIFDAQGYPGIFYIHASEITLTGITFKNSHSIDISDGVYNPGSALSFENEDQYFENIIISCTFINNTARTYGGAIDFNGDVNNSNISGTFINNSAGCYGGAINFGSLTNSNISGTFYNNTAMVGGAIYVDWLMENCTISGNFTKNSIVKDSYELGPYGGAIHVREGKNIKFTAHFADNSAVAGGGAIYILDSENVEIYSDFTNNSAAFGGAIALDYIIDSKIHSNFTDNTAWEGGAISGEIFINMDINSNFTHNRAITYVDEEYGWTSESYGGAICCNNEGFVNSTISGNFINNSADRGGAVYISVYHGGIFIQSYESFDDYYYEFYNNTINANFINNTAYAGGAIFIDGNMEDSTIEGSFINNSAEMEGGAIIIVSTSFEETTKLPNNDVLGAEIAFFGPCIINNTINANFINNNATDGAAIIIYAPSIGTKIIHCLFINNTAIGDDYEPAVIYMPDFCNETIVTNNIFLNNRGYAIVHYWDYQDEIESICIANNNWFGQNATTYMDSPPVLGNSIVCDSWLFLNATANLEDSSYDVYDVVFELFVYNGTEECPKYDHTLLEPINLTITSTGGSVDKKIAKFGDIIKFTTSGGLGSVTASVEDAQDTIFIDGALLIIEANDAKYGWANSYVYKVKFVDEKGNPLVNYTLTFTIDNQTYTVNTTEDGANVTLSLDIGTYDITISYGSNNVTKKISIIPRIVENVDMEMDYDSKSFTVRAIGDDGNPIANEFVEMTVNGKAYSVKTDKNGYAALPIELKPKTYTVTSSYKGYTVKNTIKVKYTLKAKKTFKAYKSTNKLVLTATLKWSNGKAIAGKVTFYFKGKKYTVKTDSKGIAKLNIKKSIVKKLKVGKSYRVKVAYKNESCISKVIVKK